MTSSLEVAQEMEVAFSLKENPRPSNFITKASFRDSGLALIGGPQVAFTVSPTATIPTFASDVSLEAVTRLQGCLSVIYFYHSAIWFCLFAGL